MFFQAQAVTEHLYIIVREPGVVSRLVFGTRVSVINGFEHQCSRDFSSFAR